MLNVCTVKFKINKNALKLNAHLTWKFHLYEMLTITVQGIVKMWNACIVYFRFNKQVPKLNAQLKNVPNTLPLSSDHSDFPQQSSFCSKHAPSIKESNLQPTMP